MRNRPAGVIRNPVLPGSHPDPSILRVGPDFYLATSTFEWYAGVRLHHSTDLVHWRPLGGALDDIRLVDLTGCPDSGGVWAPSLTHADGLFHLVYSNVSTYVGGFTDCPNHLITAPSIEGPWSEPVPLHARGFDASLFHDGADSRLLNLVHDWRPGHGGSAGLEARRYDRAERRLTGDPVRIELPPQAGWIEGPNLYRRGDWYYLLTADGGTGYDHQVTVSRSRTLAGPYARDPSGPLLTARDHPDLPLQKAGHGSLVETGVGHWYLAYLVARPLGRRGPCVLGRETALAPVTWTADGWPRVETGLPALEVPVGTSTVGTEHTDVDDTDGFDGPALGPQWSTLRRPPTPDWVSLTERPSHLRLRGGRSPQSLVEPSLVARRVTSARCSFEATMEYRPHAFQHLAGITAYYNTRNWHYLYVTVDDADQPVLRVASCDRGVLSVDEAGGAPLGDITRLRLGLDFEGADLRFRYDTGRGWEPFGPALDATVLSDEHAKQIEDGQIRALGFTGAFVGLWAWDLTGGGHPADFDEVTYRAGERAPVRSTG
ncbi:family 43 glycosylhydrolase [Streptomyces purpurascens]|uniref:family 43 glycosylhydrolase n=1 Tax=Streptomyces purpurascens TaxID=1924 RepID=UPI001672340F|nr:family 43 glycosylhydrolase [Streptomyces purpurascens]MCE7051566.1 family 43 glycosylhydrolase [Streptomyces purpurascens]GHA24536.1 glycoside hydrolase 43 family protein [Streptomyces purpurascens]